MSHENVEIVRTIYAQGLLDTMPGHKAMADGAIEYVNPPDAVDSGVRRGGREVQTALRGLADAFKEREHRLQRLFDGGDAVVAEVTFYGRGAGSGAQVRQDEVHTWTFREGRLIRFEWGRDLKAALKAVGLEE